MCVCVFVYIYIYVCICIYLCVCVCIYDRINNSAKHTERLKVLIGKKVILYKRQRLSDIVNDKQTLNEALPHTIVIFTSIVNLGHKNFLKSTISTLFHAPKCQSSLILKLNIEDPKINI